MGLYLAYRYLLPVVIGSIVLILFFVSRKEQEHKGWWLAFLFFGLSVALLMPMKGNPFEARKQAHEQSVHTLEQLDALTVGNGWFSQPKLAENVTDKTIQSAEKHLSLVEKRKQKKRKNSFNWLGIVGMFIKQNYFLVTISVCTWEFPLIIQKKKPSSLIVSKKHINS